MFISFSLQGLISSVEFTFVKLSLYKSNSSKLRKIQVKKMHPKGEGEIGLKIKEIEREKKKLFYV